VFSERELTDDEVVFVRATVLSITKRLSEELGYISEKE